MENRKWVRFVESFVVLPILTISSVPVGPISQAVVGVVNTPSIVSFQKQNNEASGSLAVNDATDEKLEAEKIKAEAIDSYFKTHGMPLEGMGMKMVLEAEKNEIDWRLLPAISVRESTGGQNDCKKVNFNAFGWGSCKIGFKSTEEAIEVVAKNLGGNNPKTEHYYDNKTTKQILRAYNPPSVVSRYAEQVMNIMDTIGKADEVVIPNTTT
ncbi:MAG: hypothetical protein NTZ87_03165 [Candidatus Nomurabacteria bacterium]|nr:hypothetical protein [Candidatus Nomurabacteria bacterium]